MNLKNLTVTELRILLIATPLWSEQYKEVVKEIKMRELMSTQVILN